MSKSHDLAYLWLQGKGYSNEEIKKNRKTPDFICEDGERYEAKYLYINTLLFSESQINQLLPTDHILVVGNETVVDDFLWKDRHDKKYNFIFNDCSEKVFFFRDKTLLKEINKIIAEFDSSEEVLKSFVTVYKSNPELFKTATKTTFL